MRILRAARSRWTIPFEDKYSWISCSENHALVWIQVKLWFSWPPQIIIITNYWMRLSMIWRIMQTEETVIRRAVLGLHNKYIKVSVFREDSGYTLSLSSYYRMQFFCPSNFSLLDGFLRPCLGRIIFTWPLFARFFFLLSIFIPITFLMVPNLFIIKWSIL